MEANKDEKGHLRLVVCGSPDAGESTLIERLSRDANGAGGTQGDESEGGVVRHHFETDKRAFTAFAAPERKRSALATALGASKSDIALILVDARKGVQTETRQYSHIVSLMGVRRAVLAVNKMDLVDHDEGAFTDIAREYRSAAEEKGFEEVIAVPISALADENVHASSDSMPWYDGPTLLELLETVEVGQDPMADAFRMPIQQAGPRSTSRSFSGVVASGLVERGMAVVAGLSGKRSTVERVVGDSGDLDGATPGQSITLTLADDIDIGRGDMIADADRPPGVSDQFAAHLIWLDSRPMLPQRSYAIRLSGASGIARITDLVHQVDAHSRERLATSTLGLNEVGYCKLSLDHAVPFDPYPENRQTGAFTLIDRSTNDAVGMGVIDFALRRASNIAWHAMKIDKAARSRATGQLPRVLWMTGLSGAGKSTIADSLEQKLQAMGRYTYLLDGDNVRHGLNKDLGFTEKDRVENIRRIAEVGKLMVDAGLIVIVSFISPFRAEREMARALVQEGEFVEIHVDTPLEVCEERDPKKLYAKARKGELANFTGIDSPYEPPRNPELRIDTTKLSPNDAADEVVRFLQGA